MQNLEKFERNFKSLNKFRSTVFKILFFSKNVGSLKDFKI